MFTTGRRPLIDGEHGSALARMPKCSVGPMPRLLGKMNGVLCEIRYGDLPAVNRLVLSLTRAHDQVGD
jgi:hypothetical protein